jgi:hypothetical protein
MQRRTAIATAAAITMSLTSGVVAIGANTGLFGFSANAGPVTPRVVVVQGAAPGSPAASVATRTRIQVRGGESHENQNESHTDD